MPMNHAVNWTTDDVGGLCWVSDSTQAYIEAKVTSVANGHVMARASDGREFDVDLEAPLKPPSRKQKEVPRRILQRVPLSTNQGVDNMDNLTTLHEAAILDNIQHRFRMDTIYTNTGPILIAMNPFKWLPVYGDDVINRYHGRPYGSLPPHCFQESEDAFVQLLKTRKNQAIVICGESGAGKTETTKLMLHYLSVVSKRTAERQKGAKGLESDQPTIAERMVNSNPLLEAFGNAKTMRNNNSSRFGKFTRFDFAMNSSVISGGHIENLLLEKVRVVEQGEGERNYHIFYQLLAAAEAGKFASAGECNFLGAANDPQTHEYTAHSGCTNVDGMDDVEEYEAMVGALTALGVKSPEMQLIFQVAAAVYWTGDVKFACVSSEQSMVADEPAVHLALGNVASLLGVSAQTLGASLCVRVRELRGGETVTSNNDVGQSVSLRDALAKSVFSRLFDWLVHRANQAFDMSSGKESQFIGVLDIFGFEDMKVNGFEQVFINTTNEQLQKVFNDIIFKSEEEEYTREQIDWDKTVFPDNTPCIELLTKRPSGILRLLDGECSRGNAASDGAKLASKINKQHGANPYFEVCGPASVWRRNSGERTREEDFLVHHFAGPIVYTINQFVEKNRDALFGHVYDLLTNSSKTLVKDCFPPRQEERASDMTVAHKYLGQLSALTVVLRESSSRFVRCIKTNQEKLPAKLDKPSVLRQLICSGVMAALEVRRAGFPTRVPYREFVREFRAFTPRGVTTDGKELAGKMMQHPLVRERVPASMYRCGCTKLFMQAEVLYTLQSIKNASLYPFVRRLQRWWVNLQGSILLRKFKRAVAGLAEAQVEASIKAVASVPQVCECFADGEEKRRAAWALVSLVTNCATMTLRAINALTQCAALAKELVAAAVAQKEEVYRIRASLLTEIDSGSERCTALRALGNTLYDPKDCLALCSAAKSAEEELSRCRVELLAVANQWESASLSTSAMQGPNSLRRAATHANMSNLKSADNMAASGHTPEEASLARRRKLDAALLKVREAELLTAGMLEKKQLMDEARAEFQGSLDLASERLGAIQVDVFIIAGITTVSNAVAHARDAIYAAQKALQAVDAEPCKRAVLAATAAVEQALGVAQHEAARVAAMVTLDESEKTLSEISYQATSSGYGETAALKDAISVAEDAIATARSACGYPDIAVLQQSTQYAVDAVNGTGELLEREQAKKRAEEKARFNKLLGRFQQMDEANSAAPKFAQKAGASKPLFKVKRVQVADSNVSGVGAGSVVTAIVPLPPPARAPPLVVVAEPLVAAEPALVVPAACAPLVAPLAAAAAAAAVPEMELGEWVDSKNLAKYAEYISEMADELSDLVEITDADADEIIEKGGMPKLAARRFKKALLELGAQVTPS